MRALAGLALGLCALPATAGDSATFSAFGYSEDRRYFAYEEFSIGDEATPPYATIGLVDLAGRGHAPGSPWTAEADEETEKTISDLRYDALELGGPALSVAGIADPATILALIGDGARTTGATLTFALPQGASPDALGPDLTLALTHLPRAVEDRCTAIDGGVAAGFAITLADGAGSTELYRQDAQQSAATCLRQARLYGVFQPYNGGDLDTLVAVVSLYTVGFEGYDRRFLVIPIGNPIAP